MISYSDINNFILSPYEYKRLGDTFVVRIKSLETLKDNTGTYSRTSLIDKINYVYFVLNEDFNEIYEGISQVDVFDANLSLVAYSYIRRDKEKRANTFNAEVNKQNTFAK
jgi:hypothetical protein